MGQGNRHKLSYFFKYFLLSISEPIMANIIIDKYIIKPGAKLTGIILRDPNIKADTQDTIDIAPL